MDILKSLASLTPEGRLTDLWEKYGGDELSIKHFRDLEFFGSIVSENG